MRLPRFARNDKKEADKIIGKSGKIKKNLDKVGRADI